MASETDSALIAAIHHYHLQAGHLLDVLERSDVARELLHVQLAPDGFDTGFHLAVAIQFAARALCIPKGIPAPEIQEPYSLTSLRTLHSNVAANIANVRELNWAEDLVHVAGEAELHQPVADYVARFALPRVRPL